MGASEQARPHFGDFARCSAVLRSIPKAQSAACHHPFARAQVGTAAAVKLPWKL